MLIYTLMRIERHSCPHEKAINESVLLSSGILPALNRLMT